MELIVHNDAAVVRVLLRQSYLMSYWVVFIVDCCKNGGTDVAKSVHLRLGDVELFQNLIVRFDVTLPLLRALASQYVLEVHPKNIRDTTLHQTRCHKPARILNQQNTAKRVDVGVVEEEAKRVFSESTNFHRELGTVVFAQFKAVRPARFKADLILLLFAGQVFRLRKLGSLVP